MSMRTEVMVKIILIEPLPQKVKEVLQFMFEGRCSPPQNLPNHIFFTKDHWSNIGKTCSYYHVPEVQNFYEGDYLFSRSDMKNHDNEVESFFAWLDPYCEAESGKCIGHSWYGKDLEPKLILKK